MSKVSIVNLVIGNLEKNTFIQAKWLKEKSSNDLDGEMELIFQSELIKLFVDVKK